MKKSLLIAFSLVLFSTVVYQCNKSDFKIGSRGVDNSEFKIMTDYPISLEIDTLIKESQFVVQGEFFEYVESWNMSRNVNNIIEPSTELYVEGQIYHFKVEKYLKGKGEEVIRVNLRYSDEGEIDETYLKPELNRKVVLFLLKDEIFNNYYGVMQPFVFEINDDKLEVKSNLKFIIEEFKDKKVTRSILEEKISKLK